MGQGLQPHESRVVQGFIRYDIDTSIPTAEGAIKLAIEKTEFTLHDSCVMVIGYGRIGKVLCKMLHGIGANVCPVVKEEKDAALARSYGYEPILFRNMNKNLTKMDVIFNTVPQILLDKKNIKHVRKDCLIIDLASVPHGVDYTAAKSAGVNVVYAGSLPGIVAPRTAALYIKETIYHVMDELEG